MKPPFPIGGFVFLLIFVSNDEMMFLELNIVNKSSNREKKLNPTSINLSEVVDYREYTEDGNTEKKTVFYFNKESGKSPVISVVDVEKIHKVLNTIRIKDYEQQ